LSRPIKDGDVAAIVVALHVSNDQAAERLATHVVPRLASTVLNRPKLEPRAEGIEHLGDV